MDHARVRGTFDTFPPAGTGLNFTADLSAESGTLRNMKYDIKQQLNRHQVLLGEPGSLLIQQVCCCETQ